MRVSLFRLPVKTAAHLTPETVIQLCSELPKRDKVTLAYIAGPPESALRYGCRYPLSILFDDAN